MTVAEFIKFLQKLPQEAVVLAYDADIAQPALVQGAEYNEKFVHLSTDKKDD
jgi:hypothetical protein